MNRCLFSRPLLRRHHDVELLCRPAVPRLAASLGPDRDDLLRAAGLLQARQLGGGNRPDEVAERAAQPPGRLRDNSGDARRSCHSRNVLLSKFATRGQFFWVFFFLLRTQSLPSRLSPSMPPSVAPTPSTSESAFLTPPPPSPYFTSTRPTSWPTRGER